MNGGRRLVGRRRRIGRPGRRRGFRRMLGGLGSAAAWRAAAAAGLAGRRGGGRASRRRRGLGAPEAGGAASERRRRPASAVPSPSWFRWSSAVTAAAGLAGLGAGRLLTAALPAERRRRRPPARRCATLRLSGVRPGPDSAGLSAAALEASAARSDPTASGRQPCDEVTVRLQGAAGVVAPTPIRARPFSRRSSSRRPG